MPENMDDSPALNKKGEHLNNLPTLSPDGESENIVVHSSTNRPTEAIGCGVTDQTKLNGNILVNNEADVGHEDGQIIFATENEHDSAVTSTMMQVSVEIKESTIIENKISVLTENGKAVQDDNHKRNGSLDCSRETDAVSGIKRPRITVDEQQASVHVVYNSLTRESKRKLEEALQKWSEWHARHRSSSHDSKGELESGEGTYFPALDVGLDKPSALSFWMDGQTRNAQSKEFIALDNNSIPLYDRGYSFGLASAEGSSNGNGGLEIVDGSRCFNCGSYNHALKECPKPRNNAAVNNARKQHSARRNQNSISRNPTRYYQDTPGGKFDGLHPGALDAETKKLLGLGELDPPPWLNRMREIGYPPGYLDFEDVDQPSGIEIFDDEVVKRETEDGEILDTDCPPPLPTEPPPKKMSVQFPGVNAPIPENADEWRWAARAWKFDLPRNRSNHRSYNSTEPATRPLHHEERWAHGGYRDDWPPGVNPGNSPDYVARSASYARSLSERGRRSPLVRETGSSHDDERWNPYPPERKERHDERHHHRSWR